MAQPQATICYIVTGGKVLLIHKLRGVGAGKINGPGGKVEPGETPLAAAIRETEEEIGVTPLNLQQRGELWFHFSPDHIVHCLIFLAADFSGQLRCTAEAIPEWFFTDSLPYDRMWEDDREWLPLLLTNQQFEGDVYITNGVAHTTNLKIIRNV